MIARRVCRPSTAVLVSYNALIVTLLVRHFHGDHRVCTGSFAACSAFAAAAHSRFVIWSAICVIGDLSLMAAWLAFGMRVDPRLSHHEIAGLRAPRRLPRRRPDPAPFYPTISDDLLVSYDGDEDLRR